MKLSKKVLAGFSAIALLATAAVFTSCSDDDDDAFDGDRVDFDNSYVVLSKDANGNVTDIKHAKDSTVTGAEANNKYYYRAFNLLKTKHYDATCTITLTPNAGTEAEGNCGFVFGKTNSEDDGAYDFGVATVQALDNNKIRYYVSWYKGAVIKKNNFQDKSNFLNSNGDAITSVTSTNWANSTSGEFEAATWTNLDSLTKGTDGNVAVKILVKAEDNGSYSISFFAPDADAKTATPLKTVTVESNITGLSARTQTYIGRYAMIKPAKHLTGLFEFADIAGNAIPAEFED